MSATNTRKKTITAAAGAAVAAAAAPALLFLGTGTAQANTAVQAFPGPLGVTVRVHELSGLTGWCSYHAAPASTPPDKPVPLPYHSLPFLLQAHSTFDIPIPAIPTGSTWDVSVVCDHGGPNLTATWPNPLVY